MVNYKQELPPPGGYQPLTWCRIPLKRRVPNIVRVGLFIGISAGGFMVFKHTKHQMNLNKIEMRCSRLAMLPLILAEGDRNFLKQLKMNRDNEEALMKDVPGWEIGKWKGYPVYFSVGPDEFFRPDISEFFAHGDPKCANFVGHTNAYI